jgi:hypothetical protein
MEWYGILVLKDPDPFDRILSAYFSSNLEMKVGTLCVFEWLDQRNTLIRSSVYSSVKPVRVDQGLAVQGDSQPVLVIDKPVELLSQHLVEAFLDDRTRNVILDGLKSPEQRTEPIRWLLDQKFPVYRQLTGPKGTALEQPVLPPKFDFLKFA